MDTKGIAQIIGLRITSGTGPQDSTPLTTDRDGYVWSNDPAFSDTPGLPEPEQCKFCGAALYHRGVPAKDSVIWVPVADRCTCPEAVAAYEQEQAERAAKEEAERRAEENRRLQEKVKQCVGDSGMGERFLRRTFGTFQETEDNRRALAVCLKYVQGFDDMLPKRGEAEPGRNGLFISGPPGTGKTHLAAAIANQLLAQGRPVICMTMIDLLERIKRTYSRAGADEGDVLQVYKRVPLLVIDDIGKEPPTEWAISTVYNIINARYEAYLPVVVTTNYDTAALISRMTPRNTGDNTTAMATIDRLLEMCKGVPLTGQSWRRK